MNLDGSQDLLITFRTDLSEMFNELQNEDVEVEIKKHSRRRSLDANALAWVIIDEIAAKTRIKKSEVYRNAIRDIGGVSDTVCVKNNAVSMLTKGWTDHGLGWQVEIQPSRLPGCSNVTLYYGSSVFDSAQMAALIDSLMQDAESLGIPTRSQQEIEKSLEIWSRKKAKHEDKQVSSESNSQEEDEEALY